MLFLVTLFLLKTTSVFKNTETYKNVSQKNGLTYGNETLESLVNKDTDVDGILDWEEDLWGTDPTKKETTPGTSDKLAIEKLKLEQEKDEIVVKSQIPEEDLTKTDQFSRELFATIAALNQEGTIDQATIDALSISLTEKIQNATPQKIYVLANIRIIDNESVQAIQKYREVLVNVYDTYNTEKKVTEVLEELMNDEENMSILKELDPIINETDKIINQLIKMEVPKSLSLLHLDLINISQRLLENIRGIKLFENDPILAIGAVSQYFENTLTLESVANRLVETTWQKLNN